MRRMTSLVDWAPFIAAEVEAARGDAASVTRAWSTAKRKSIVASDRGDEAAPPGDHRVASILRCLDAIEGFPRSDTQKRFHNAFINACLPHIYGTTDFEKHRERILGKFGMKTVQFECLICTPRRFGKTTAVSMFCAVLLAVCPDMWISVFSTGQRASSSLLDQTAKFFRMLKYEGVVLGSNDNILKKNQEELFTRGSTPSDIRRMYSYPSTVAGLKGVGGKVLIMEEASRLDEAVFKEVLLPLIGVRDSVLLGISTPLDENNFYRCVLRHEPEAATSAADRAPVVRSVMLDMKRPDGTKLFNAMSITLLCEACEKAGKLECPHVNVLPAWKSGERQELIASLMANDRAMYIQENLGIIVRRDNAAFDKASLDRFQATRYSLVTSPAPRFLYVCIDPAGGGPSALALVACFYSTAGHLIICGADSATVTNDSSQVRGLYNGIMVKNNAIRIIYITIFTCILFTYYKQYIHWFLRRSVFSRGSWLGYAMWWCCRMPALWWWWSATTAGPC